VSPTEQIRSEAKVIVGQENFIEIFVNTSLEVCEARDTKGLYAKARTGEVKNFTGISAPFESPENPNIVVETENQTVEDSANYVLAHVLPFIKA
jgi:adenylylsulfate kinase